MDSAKPTLTLNQRPFCKQITQFVFRKSFERHKYLPLVNTKDKVNWSVHTLILYKIVPLTPLLSLLSILITHNQKVLTYNWMTSKKTKKNWRYVVLVAWIMHVYSLLSSKCISLSLSVWFVCFALMWDLRSTPCGMVMAKRQKRQEDRGSESGRERETEKERGENWICAVLAQMEESLACRKQLYSQHCTFFGPYKRPGKFVVDWTNGC